MAIYWLHYTAKNGRVPAVKFLVVLTTDKGSIPLQHALKESHNAILKFLHNTYYVCHTHPVNPQNKTTCLNCIATVPHHFLCILVSCKYVKKLSLVMFYCLDTLENLYMWWSLWNSQTEHCNDRGRNECPPSSHPPNWSPARVLVPAACMYLQW